MRVYVAGPYSQGDQIENVTNALSVGEALMQDGFIPFVPHLNAFWHLNYPHSWEEWMGWCLAWVEVCDVVVRLPGESRGADREVSMAKALRKPVVIMTDYNLTRLLNEMADVATSAE